MDPFESSTHSFVVKIWLESSGEESETPVWRGHITHVPSKQRRYVDDLSEITEFITIYLEHMGVQTDEEWRSVDWLLKGRNASSN